MQETSFDEVIDLILSQDKRYTREAYYFVRESLDHTQRMVGKAKKGEIRHVSGQELLAGFREFALQQFGPMTITVLHEWGILQCGDVGEIVFNMVESGVLAKTEKDSRDDFRPGFEFEEAFRRPFLPSSRKDQGATLSPTGSDTP